jgi:predicted DNA-binding transcriptional regulator YafY
MRADRLVAELLMLQRRRTVTASEVAAELEISERTARRDLEALGIAGFPVYSRQGRHGGWELLGGAKTDLSGLTADEVRALFLVVGPASATPAVAAALRKLVRALPEPFRDRAELALSAVVIDQRGWGGVPGGQRGGGESVGGESVGGESVERPLSHLDSVQRAVIESRIVRLTYLDRQRNPSTRLVRPLGLASKQGRWYAIADTDSGRRTFRVDRMIDAELLDEVFQRPAGFDIKAEWMAVIDAVELRRHPLTADLAVSPEAVPLLRYLFGNRLRLGPARRDGRVEAQVDGPSTPMLASELAGLGGQLEVVSPPEIRHRLAELAGELQAIYNEEPAYATRTVWPPE